MIKRINDIKGIQRKALFINHHFKMPLLSLELQKNAIHMRDEEWSAEDVRKTPGVLKYIPNKNKHVILFVLIQNSPREQVTETTRLILS